MSIDVEALLKICIPFELSYTDRDVMMYALGVGLGDDPLNEQELAFVYEKELKTIPTFAATLGNVFMDVAAQTGLDLVKLLHGEQYLKINQALPAEAAIFGEVKLTEFIDKGKEKGAIALIETTIYEKQSGDLLCTAMATAFFRGNGGQGGSDGSLPKANPLPQRPADTTCELATKPNQALLYRLSGDRNPLHCEPAFASRANFERPILHGLCTYGIACRAIVQTYCDYDSTRIKTFNVRFSAPVYPGETIVTEMWKDKGVISFRCKVKERDIMVINNGRCDID